MRACKPKRLEQKRERESTWEREHAHMRECERETVRAKESPGPLAPLFICFLLPLGLPYVTWASQERCLFYLRSSLWSSALPLFCFFFLCFYFPSLSFSHHHSGLSFSYSNYLTLLMNIQDWFPLGLTGLISFQSKGLSRVFSNTTLQKHQFFSAQTSL